MEYRHEKDWLDTTGVSLDNQVPQNFAVFMLLFVETRGREQTVHDALCCEDVCLVWRGGCFVLRGAACRDFLVSASENEQF